MEKKDKKKIIYKIACVLFVLYLFFLASYVPYSYAKYKASTSGTTEIALASWSVSIAGGNNSITVTSGGATTDITLTTTNNSEVDVTYSLILSNVPSGVSVKVDNGTYYAEQNNSITIPNIGTLAVNGTNTHTLTFKADLDATEVENQQIGVDVEFKQKND